MKLARSSLPGNRTHRNGNYAGSFTLLLVFGALQLALMGYFEPADSTVLHFSLRMDTRGIQQRCGLEHGSRPAVSERADEHLANLSGSAGHVGSREFYAVGQSEQPLRRRVGVLRPQRLQAQASVQLNASVLGGNVSLNSGSVNGRRHRQSRRRRSRRRL